MDECRRVRRQTGDWLRRIAMPLGVVLSGIGKLNYLCGSRSLGIDWSASRRAARVATPSLGKARWR
jgi:hypothetical protein